jgi:hypothetical protein
MQVCFHHFGFIEFEGQLIKCKYISNILGIISLILKVDL